MPSSARGGRSGWSERTSRKPAGARLLNEKINGEMSMTSAPFDYAPLLPAGLPVPAARWTGLAKYSFVGGNNDPEQVPLDGPLDDEGMRMDALADALADLKRRGVTPKYIYTIPTVQNPTGSILPEARRAEMLLLSQQYGVPVFEDDCYADLIWDGRRPPAIYAMSKTNNVIHVGSFSKSIAPALRVGFIVAPWVMMSRMLALKTDAGSGALEQMVLAEYCAPHFTTHIPKLARGLRAKLDTLMEALNEQFGTSAEFEDPKGGIFLWVKLPDHVDTLKLYQAALAAGVAINPGPEWSTNKAYAGSRLRRCFASPSHEQIHQAVSKLAEICRQEFGVPARIANVARHAPA